MGIERRWRRGSCPAAVLRGAFRVHRGGTRRQFAGLVELARAPADAARMRAQDRPMTTRWFRIAASLPPMHHAIGRSAIRCRFHASPGSANGCFGHCQKRGAPGFGFTCDRAMPRFHPHPMCCWRRHQHHAPAAPVFEAATRFAAWIEPVRLASPTADVRLPDADAVRVQPFGRYPLPSGCGAPGPSTRRAPCRLHSHRRR